MKVTHQSKDYSPDNVVTRYVRKNPVGDGYTFCEVGADRRYNIRRGSVEASEIDDEIRLKADSFADQVFGYVEWPATVALDETDESKSRPEIYPGMG